MCTNNREQSSALTPGSSLGGYCRCNIPQMAKYKLCFKNIVGSYWHSCWQHQYSASRSIPFVTEHTARPYGDQLIKECFPNLHRHIKPSALKFFKRGL